MDTSVKRVLLGAGLTALLLGGVAPLAHAGPGPELGDCFVSGDESPAPGLEPGEGFLFVVGSDEPLDAFCEYTASGLDATYRITGLSAWELTRTRALPAGGTETTVIASEADLIEGGSRAASAPFETQNGDVIRLTAKAGCAPDSDQCGTLLAATVGSDPDPSAL